MFWGYIKFTGKKNLVIVTGSLNSVKYMDILKDHLLEDVQEGDLFQHDNAPALKSQKTARFLSSNGVQLLENWPPQSPDLSIIENLWSYLKVKVMKRCPKTVSEFCQYAIEEYSHIPTDYVQTLYCSISNQLKMVVRNEGYHTKY